MYYHVFATNGTPGETPVCDAHHIAVETDEAIAREIANARTENLVAILLSPSEALVSGESLIVRRWDRVNGVWLTG